MKQIRIFSVSVFMAILSVTTVTGQNLWNMQPDGSISWIVKKAEAHSDNIEMSGRFMSGESVIIQFLN